MQIQTPENYEQIIMNHMCNGNRSAVQEALDAENYLKQHGSLYSQALIDSCAMWLSENTFDEVRCGESSR